MHLGLAFAFLDPWVVHLNLFVFEVVLPLLLFLLRPQIPA